MKLAFSIPSLLGLILIIFYILLLQDPPFIFKANETLDGDPCSGNDCFTGYAVDLLDKLSTELLFTYNLYEVPDGRYGKPQEDGSWNGLVEQLFNTNGFGETVSSHD